MIKIDTTAIVNAMEHYRTYTGDLSWQEWILKEGGIEYVKSNAYPWAYHADRVVDEEQYMLFVLKWAS